MKQRTKRLLVFLLVGFLATAGAVRAYYPDIWEKTGRVLEEQPLISQALRQGEQKTRELEVVLGEKIEQTQGNVERGNFPVETIVSEVLNDSTLAKEIQTRVETVVTEKTQEIQELPKEAVDQVKQEVKKELKRQMCEEWLGN